MAQRIAEVPAADGQVPRRVSSVVRDVTLLGYLVVVLVITLWPSPPDPASLGWLERALTWAHDHGLPAAVGLPVVEAVANVVLFVPLGALLPWARAVRPVLAVAAACALSTAIELTQLALPERFPTLQDVALNTLGGALGAAAVVVLRARRDGRRPVGDLPPPADDGPHPADDGPHPADLSRRPLPRPTGGHGPHHPAAGPRPGP